ncbi:hypothetical protein KVV02_001605 [Mortierella alpina]|uniref:Uncharacterized protein n=1 Tax=Mortierella alpina TaxID=64518 RepID=A0A9P8CVS9_MORAP|nr:hypothetical protein KVV02_001605 [Mortierella alpina]
MDTTPAQHPNDTVVHITATSNSRALFIAEVLAGCAAAILLMVIVCCFCSGAARRRSHRDQASVRDLFSLRRGSEVSETGRQTPDAAPAYSTTSPLGPLSPEVVEAISRASIDRRHSLVVSILSSSNSLQNQLGSATSGIQIGSGLPSMASTFIPDLPLPIGALSVRSQSTSPRSSMTAERPSRDGGDGGEEQHLTGSSSSPRSRPGRLSTGSPLPFMHHMQRDPPSYDPNWRSSLQLPTHHTYDHLHRSRHLSTSRIAPLVRLDPAPHSGDEADQGETDERYSVNQTLLNPSNNNNRHRRTGSVNTTTPLRAETTLSPPSIVFEVIQSGLIPEDRSHGQGLL